MTPTDFLKSKGLVEEGFSTLIISKNGKDFDFCELLIEYQQMNTQKQNIAIKEVNKPLKR
jgi:hypothetical protein